MEQKLDPIAFGAAQCAQYLASACSGLIAESSQRPGVGGLPRVVIWNNAANTSPTTMIANPAGNVPNDGDNRSNDIAVNAVPAITSPTKVPL